MDRQFGLGPIDERSLSAAIRDFETARRKALLQRILGRLTGQSVALLSFDKVARQLRANASVERGLRQIPLDAIVGSVGRYSDFTRTFLPQKKSDLQRWATVRAASNEITELPPIKVYQIGDAYFVLDGNHRVSIARQQGFQYIDAEVIEVRTRVPLSADDQPDTLIIKAEFAAFLEFTGLDRLRPDSDLIVSVPGQYTRLENHIEVHRYFVELAESRELRDEEAVVRWYDESYLPLVHAIREQGILRYFPGRTETDFYVWLATHMAELKHEYDWRFGPAAAVSKIASQLPLPSAFEARTIGHRILRAYGSLRHRDRRDKQIFAHGRLLARYSDRLFSDLLVSLDTEPDAWNSLDHAVEFARRDGAHLHGLIVAPSDAVLSKEKMRSLEKAFNRRCSRAAVQGSLAFQEGVQSDAICKRALLSDLVVLERKLPATGEAYGTGDSQSFSLIRRLARPVLLVSGPPEPFDRILLAYDDGSKAKEALFISAYIAERWRSDLVVVAVSEPTRRGKDMLAHARTYLSMHEVDASYVVERGPVSTAIVQAATGYQRDLIIMGASFHSRFLAGIRVGTTGQVLQTWEGRLLLCS